MKMITNLIKPTSGEIEIFGEKLTDTSYEVLKRMGTIIEYPIFYDKLTAKENLELHCEYMGYYDKNEIDHALHLVKLQGIDNKSKRFFIRNETTTRYCKGNRNKARTAHFR